jgi:lipopolysaccharide transport system permease protein
LFLYYDLRPGASFWALPFFVLLALGTGLGVGLLIASLSLRYRDVRQMIPFFTQIWFFASPIAYSASLIPEDWRVLYSINPLIGVIEGFRWSLLGTGNMTGRALALSAATALLVLVTGLFYFRRVERTAADVV